ncbi:MAG: acyltransferase [Oscillospiraceae bacterium]|jgi:surface polysaccharide O-acyltransferase-like enzyme|nr:acyltransferase [Oscillospiraceae bacterium]
MQSDPGLPGKQSRNQGLELLRMVSMVTIVLCHVLRIGGMIDAVADTRLPLLVYLFLRIFGILTLNCFALTSGYVSLHIKTFRPSRPAAFWLSVIGWCAVGLALQVIVTRRAPTTLEWLWLMPVTTREYWYVTDFFALTFFIPLLNAAIARLPKRQFQWMLLVMFLLFCCWSMIRAEVIELGNGHSLWWLIVMYFAGAYLRLYGAPAWLKKHTLLVFWAAAAVNALAEYVALYVLRLPIGWPGFNHPLHVLSALSLFLFFVRKETFRRRAVSRFACFFGPISFGVYLVHMQPFFQEHFLKDRFKDLFGLSWPLAGLAAVGLSVGIAVGSALLEFGRVQLFRLLRLDRLPKKLDVLYDRCVGWIRQRTAAESPQA